MSALNPSNGFTPEKIGTDFEGIKEELGIEKENLTKQHESYISTVGSRVNSIVEELKTEIESLKKN